MKQKTCNILVSICNLVIPLLFIVFSNTLFVDIKFRMYGIRGEEFLEGLFLFLFIMLGIVNLVFMFQNRKNKIISLYAISIFAMLPIYIEDLKFFILNDLDEIILFLPLFLPILFGLKNIVLTIKNKLSKKNIIVDIFVIALVIAGVIFGNVILENVEIETELYLLILVSITTSIQYIFNKLSIEQANSKKEKIGNLILLTYILFGMYVFINYYYYEPGIVIAWLVISFIMQIIYNIKIDIKEENKIKKVINSIICILLLVISALTTYKTINYLCNLKKVDNNIMVIVEQVKNKTKEIDTSVSLVKVYDNNKWGLINQSGKVVIPIEYDEIVLFEEGIIAVKDEEFKILTNDGKFITSYNKEEVLLEEEFDNSVMIDLGRAIYRRATENINTLNNYDKKKYIKLNLFYANELEGYQGNLLNGYEILLYTKSENVFDIEIRNDFYIVYQEENVKFVLDYYNLLPIYINGNIPFYNLENKIQGWYDIDTWEKHLLEGDYQILDLVGDKVILKDYNSKKEEKLITMNKGDISSLKGEYEIIDILNDKVVIKQYDNVYGNIYIMNNNFEILLEVKEIYTTENGFIVRKENNKCVYLNKELNELTNEFDYISAEYIEKNLLIGFNWQNENIKYTLVNTDGDIIINEGEYQLIGTDMTEYDWQDYSINKEYILDYIYAEYYSNND